MSTLPPATNPQRAAPRAAAFWTVSLWGADHPDAVCINVSLGGMALAVVSPVPVGTLLRVSAMIPDGRAINMTAVVVWARRCHGAPRIGLRFVQLNPDALVAVNDHVSTSIAA